jgi:hypothetical protein
LPTTLFAWVACSLISRIEAPSSSVAPATLCTFDDVFSDEAEAARAWLSASDAMLDSVRAVVSMRATFSVTAAITAVTVARKSPIICSMPVAR